MSKCAIDFMKFVPKKERYPRNASKAFLDKEATSCCSRWVVIYTSPALKQTFRDATFFFLCFYMYLQENVFLHLHSHIWFPITHNMCFIDHEAVTRIAAVGDVALFDQSAKNTGQIPFCSSSIVP